MVVFFVVVIVVADGVVSSNTAKFSNSTYWLPKEEERTRGEKDRGGLVSDDNCE